MSNGSKLELLIPRLASDFDGEVVATARAIRRVLEADGLDLHDLARVASGVKARPKEPPGDDIFRPGDIVAAAEQLLEACSWLNSWERTFLYSIRDQARNKYGFKLSVKQRARFDELLRKHAGGNYGAERV